MKRIMRVPVQCTQNVSTIILVILFGVVQQGFANHGSFCFRFPKDKLLDDSYKNTGHANPKSVGVEKFPPDIWGKYTATLEGNSDGLDFETKSDIFLVPEIQLRLHIYPIYGRPNGPEALTGWFRVEVTLGIENAFTDFVRSFVLFVTDAQNNFVGTFEHDPFIEGEQGCPKSDATRHMIIPCGGVSKYEPFASNVVLFARNNSKLAANASRNFTDWPKEYEKYWPIVPDYEDKYSLNFYYRYSFQASNLNDINRLVFRVIVDPDPLYRIYLPHNQAFTFGNHLTGKGVHFEIRLNSVPGAADPLPSDKTTLACNRRPAGQGLNNKHPDEWYEEGEHLKLNYIWYMDVFLDGLSVQSHEKTEESIYTKTGCISPNYYGGRCNFTLCSYLRALNTIGHAYVRRPNPDLDLIPQIKNKKMCECKAVVVIDRTHCWGDWPLETPKYFNNKVTQFHGLWTHYKTQVTGSEVCSKTKEEAEEIIIRVIRRTPINQTKLGEVNITYVNSTMKQSIDLRGVRIFGFGTVLYSIRKGHGVLMILMSIFCVPISIFVSRYYKETFMTKRILYSRVWFQIHIQLVFWMCTLFVAGLVLAFAGRGFLGVSLHPYGVMHRVLGWITFAIFIVITLTGGIRLYDEPGRKISIMTHWTLGYILYIFNMLSVISSIHVPGSPITQLDKSISNKKSLEGTINIVYIIISFWILFELVIHVTMNFLLHTYDRWMQVELPRKYLPPFIGCPIPVLKENANFDASGHGIRLIIFWIYIGISTLTTLLIAGICMKGTPSEEKGFGPMSCTHEWNSTLSKDLYNSVQYELRKVVDSSCMRK